MAVGSCCVYVVLLSLLLLTAQSAKSPRGTDFLSYTGAVVTAPREYGSLTLQSSQSPPDVHVLAHSNLLEAVSLDHEEERSTVMI